jgi:hypothetical protein
MINRLTIVSFFLLSLSCFSQQKFTSDEYGLEITFPDGWNVEKGTQSMVAVIARLNNTTSINIIVQENDKWKDSRIEDMDKESFRNELEGKYKDHFKNFKTIDFGGTIVNGNNALYFVYNCDLNNDVIHAKQYFIFNGDKIYVISTGCLESEYTNYFEIPFNECVNTFTFIK